MTDTEGYAELCAFMKTQDYLGPIELDALKGAKKRDELGITSLGVIMLVANYMESIGVSNGEFNPDWIERLDDVAGIVSVLREIDREKSKAG